jgi:hypothetical protein
MRSNKKLTVAVAGLVTAGVISLAGVAYAIFSQSTTATIQSSSAEMQPLQVESKLIDYAGSETRLWPNTGGNHVAEVVVTVMNLNEVPVRVTADNVTGSIAFDGTPPSACKNKIKLTEELTVTPAELEIPAGQSRTLTVKGVYLDETATNACQNLPYTTNWTILGEAA